MQFEVSDLLFPGFPKFALRGIKQRIWYRILL